MGRSVSYASNSVIVNYINVEDLHEDDWDFFIEDLRERLKSQFPNLSNTDKFLGREDMAILENSLVYIGVSEYAGLMSLWIVPKYNDYGYAEHEVLALNWIEQIRKKFEAYGDLVKTGHMSNGVGVYRKKESITS